MNFRVSADFFSSIQPASLRHLKHSLLFLVSGFPSVRSYSSNNVVGVFSEAEKHLHCIFSCGTESKVRKERSTSISASSLGLDKFLIPVIFFVCLHCHRSSFFLPVNPDLKTSSLTTGAWSSLQTRAAAASS